MRTHTVLGDYPMQLPQKKFDPQDISAFGWMLQSQNKKSMASSSLPGFESEKAQMRMSELGGLQRVVMAGEYFVMDLGKKVRVQLRSDKFCRTGYKSGCF